MRETGLTGKVQTVLGVIDADSLGVTLPHEHLLLDMSKYFIEPAEASAKLMAYQPMALDNLYWSRAHRLNHLDDLRLLDENTAIKEALLYKLAGGDTIVDLTSVESGRDPLALARISRATGLNVIMGTGYYIGMFHPPELDAKTEEEITEEIVRDIIVGTNHTKIRAGIIGEIGCSKPLADKEQKMLRVSAAAQRRTGAAINIHTSPDGDLALKIIKVLRDAGANLSHTVLSHVDFWSFSLTTLRKLLDAGCFIEFDTFGDIGIPIVYQGQLLEMPSDMQRLKDIKQLIDEGYLKQILVSHDVCFKHSLATYGGNGYAHILRNILPLMQAMGISNEQIHILLVENPKRLLKFAPVAD